MYQTATEATEIHACFCIGPQNGEPYCPCRMRYERQREMSLMLKMPRFDKITDFIPTIPPRTCGVVDSEGEKPRYRIRAGRRVWEEKEIA